MHRESWKKLGVWNGVDFGDLYWVSSHGRVACTRRDKIKILKQRYTEKGYKEVSLYFSAKQYPVRVHRLVCSLYKPNIFGFNTVEHLDGDKAHNAYWNLTHMSAANNSARGRMMQGYAHHPLRFRDSIILATNVITGV